MGSASTTIGSPVALGIIMFGLGLSLTPRDFASTVADAALRRDAAPDAAEVTPPER